MAMFDDLIPQQQASGMFDDLIPATPSVAEDVAKSAAIGPPKAAIGLAGLPGDISELGARGLDVATRYIGGKLGYDIPERPNQEPLGGSAQIQRGVESLTGPLYNPKTTPGEYAQTLTEFAPAMVGGPGSLLAKFATRVAAPALASETAGQITKGTEAEPYARMAGAVAGGMAPLSRVVTPLPISAERQAMIDALKSEGVTSLTAGQATGRKGLQWAEGSLSDLPFAGGHVTEIADKQARQLTRAALKRIGVDAELATPEVIDAGVSAIGKKFTDLSARNTLRADRKLDFELAVAKKEYESLTLPHQRAPVVDKLIGEISSGTMPGEQYQAIRSQLSKQAESLKTSNGPLSNALRDIRKALDGAMNRSISPADRGKWAEARREWGNWKTLAKANISGEGIIGPTTLKQAARSGKREDYARGRGDFNELARSASEIMKPLPQSGTAPRSYAQNFAPSLLAGIGGGAGLGGFPGALAGLMAVLSPPMTGRALMSKPMQRYLKNQLLAEPPDRNLLISGILGSLVGR